MQYVWLGIAIIYFIVLLVKNIKGCYTFYTLREIYTNSFKLQNIILLALSLLSIPLYFYASISTENVVDQLSAENFMLTVELVNAIPLTTLCIGCLCLLLYFIFIIFKPKNFNQENKNVIQKNKG